MILSFVTTNFLGFLEARAKNVKNFVGFLGFERTRLFAFEIYYLAFSVSNKKVGVEKKYLLTQI
jgi:hypothetical protein